jgi:hypothetical protein
VVGLLGVLGLVGVVGLLGLFGFDELLVCAVELDDVCAVEPGFVDEAVDALDVELLPLPPLPPQPATSEDARRATTARFLIAMLSHSLSRPEAGHDC